MTEKSPQTQSEFSPQEAINEIIAEIDKLETQYEDQIPQEVPDTSITGRINFKANKSWLSMVNMVFDLVKLRWREGLIVISPKLLEEMDRYQNMATSVHAEAYKLLTNEDVERATDVMEKVRAEMKENIEELPE